MFLQHFQFADQPFGATPDPRFLFQSQSHREALASLHTGFYGNRGFTVLIADPGMGKTTLIFDFLDHIRDRARTVFLFDTLCEPRDILSLILQDLGLSPGETAAERHRQLNDVIAEEARADRRVVLVIDEAQNLSVEALEAVRLLTNFETSRLKLLQIVLVGQHQLADKLARPEVTQLRQRVSTICRLARFDAADTAAYVQHRLNIVGHTGAALFDTDALQMLTEASQGVPRVINTLCFNSLCLCRARNTMVVDKFTMAEAIADLQLPTVQIAIGPLHLPSPVTDPMPSEPTTNLPIPAIALELNKTEPIPPIAVPVAEFAALPTSSNRNLIYIAAALLTICVGLAGAGWWMHKGGFHDQPLVRTLLSYFRPVPERHATPQGAVHIQAVETATTATTAFPVAVKPTLSPASQSHTLIAPKQVRILPGDTLRRIARENLGTDNERILSEIRLLNPHITDTNHIETGRILLLPGQPDETSAGDRTQP